MTLPRPWLPDREFFNIGEACRVVGLPDYTLRYWESRLRLLRPARRASGHRRYTKKDLELILRVKGLLKDRHMTLAGARRTLLRELRPDRPDPASGAARAGSPAGAGGLERSALALKFLRELRSELQGLLSEFS